MPSDPLIPSSPLRVRVGGVYVRDDELLLVRHQKNGQSYWLLPGGGVEPGESMPKALERETLEECGLVTQTEQLLFVSEAISPNGQRHILNMTFLGRILEGTPELRETDGRIVEVAFVPRGILRSLPLFPDFWDSIEGAWSSGFAEGTQYLGNIWRELK